MLYNTKMSSLKDKIIKEAKLGETKKEKKEEVVVSSSVKKSKGKKYGKKK